MTSHELRRSFLGFFRSLDHAILPGSSLVPLDDPTLLFTNAGMNQFKGVFLGQTERPAPRVATVQKCLRVSGKHNDLEEVGTDEHHHTFFEMLGNWSFADYYKAEAIEFAWRYLTRELGIDPERLWVTVHEQDDEAKALWPHVTGIPSSRVLSFGDKDNFWEMGEVGPCGPCTEIHYDLGPAYGPDFPTSGPNDPHVRRWIELWNLVFIQFERGPDGGLIPLAHRFVDTGMGFERLLAILQGVPGNYHTDLFTPLMAHLSRCTGGARSFDTDPVAFRAIADHVRALTFAIADGVIPSNEGRGYVLRRILRRASRYGRKLGLDDPFLYLLSGTVVEIMAEDYPELAEARSHVAAVIHAEEEGFAATLDRGLALFQREVERLRAKGGSIFPGDVVFRLYDTYGFPPDLTLLMAREEGLGADMEGFDARMEAQRQASRQAISLPSCEDEGPGGGVFVGYDTLELVTRVLSTDPAGGIRTGEEGWVVLAECPFYPEGGGQVADEGSLAADDLQAAVVHAARRGGGVTCRVRVDRGSLRQGMEVRASVDRRRRLRIQAHHTGTHLLHAALRAVLGSHVRQSGSLVSPEKLRFDFSHFRPISAEELTRVEDLVNGWVEDDRVVTVRTDVPLETARAEGALAFFGEKYGETVRVVTVPGVSMELCGGTHVTRTSQIGPFHVTGESGIAAGIRRIEAHSGMALLDRLTQVEGQLSAIGQVVGSQTDVVERVSRLLERVRELEAALADARMERLASTVRSLLERADEVGTVRVAAAELPGASREELRAAADVARTSSRGTILVVGTRTDSAVHLLVAVTDDLVAKGVHAGRLVGSLAQVAGGKGGGRAHLAEAGARLSPEALSLLSSLREEAIRVVREQPRP